MAETNTPTVDPRTAATANFISGFEKEMAEPQEEPKAKEIVEEPAKEPVSQAPKVETRVSGKDEKPNETADSDDKWPRTAVEWKKFRAARDEQIAKREARIKEMEAELTVERQKAAKPPEVPGDYESIKKERETLSEQLRLVAVEKHPRFQAYFDQKTAAQMAMVKNIVGETLTEKVSGLLKLPDGPYKTAQLEEVMAEMSPLTQNRIGGVLNALAAIEVERDQEISKAKENYEQIVAQNQNQAKERRTQAERLFNETVSRLSDKDKGVAVFQKRDGNEDWNKEVEQRVEMAKNLIFGQPKPEAFIQSALHAAAYPRVLAALEEAGSEVDRLRAQIAELTKSTPKIEGQKKVETPETVDTRLPDIKPGMRPMDVAARWMKGLPNE